MYTPSLAGVMDALLLRRSFAEIGVADLAAKASLMEALASQGYTVLAIQHAEQLAERRALTSAEGLCGPGALWHCFGDRYNREPTNRGDAMSDDCKDATT
jgi:hypothetical protein